MASQVLSGSGNVSYTNNTGQNVRVVINYLSNESINISMSWAGVTVRSYYGADPSNKPTIGRNLAFNVIDAGAGPIANNNAIAFSGSNFALPTEIMLAPGQTFSASGDSASGLLAYNIVIIPEAG